MPFRQDRAHELRCDSGLRRNGQRFDLEFTVDPERCGVCTADAYDEALAPQDDGVVLVGQSCQRLDMHVRSGRPAGNLV